MSLWLLGPTRASTLPGVSLSTATFRIARRRSLWTSFLTSSTPVAFTCERETSGFLRTQSSWLLTALSLRQVCELVTLRFQWDRTFRFLCACFKCHKFGHGKDKCRRPNALCGRCGKEHADQHQCTAAAHCINCKGDHPAFSKQCPKFLEEQAILRYKAEHGGTFQQARAAVIVDTPRTVSSRTYAQATKLSLKSSKATQPKASDKVSASVTSKANAQTHTPPSSPKGAVSRPADKPRARKPSKEGAPREPINRFGNVSDMDIDSISDYLSDERKSRSRNTRSLERPLPLSQSQPQSPARSRSRARPLPPPHSPTHHIPPLIPPTADGDPIPVNSPPPPPARYPTSPQVVVRTGAGRAANGLRGPPKGGLPGQNN